MKMVIRFSSAEELKALPILLRHSPGTILPERTYVVSPEAARALQDAGIKFTQVATETHPPNMSGAPVGERI